MSSAAQLEMRRFNLNSIQIDNWPALSGPFYLCLRLAPALRPLCALNLPAGSVGRGAGFEPPSSRPDPFGSGFGSRCSLAGIRGPRWAFPDPPADVRGPRWMSPDPRLPGFFNRAGSPGYRVKLRSFCAKIRDFRAAAPWRASGCMGHVFDK